MKYIALIVAILSGWVISQFLLDGATGAFVSVLFAYHFFLAFLIGYMDWSDGVKIPATRAATVHIGILAFLIVFIAARLYIPAFGLVSAFAPLICFLEVEWIFGKERKQREIETVPGLPYSASQSDYSEFLKYLQQPSRQFAKAGRPVQEEYGFWLADRNKMRAANQGRGSAVQGGVQNP